MSVFELADHRIKNLKAELILAVQSCNKEKEKLLRESIARLEEQQKRRMA